MPHGIIALVFRCKIAGGHLVTNDKVTAFHRADQADIRQFTSDAYAVRLLDALCERTAPPPASTTEPSCSTETPHAPAALPNLAVFDQGGAYGAAGPASAPASGLREAPAGARRATPLGQQIKAAHLRAGHTADSRLPRRTSVQLAVAARQGRPFGAVAKAIGFSRPWTRRPLTRISAYRGRREQSRPGP